MFSLPRISANEVRGEQEAEVVKVQRKNKKKDLKISDNV